MQLKVCLLIGFVLNVACLNNLSGKFLNRKYDSLKADSSSLVELFADQISLRKNESLVESLKKDPSSFVELFAKADPERISQIIGILEGLISDAASSLETLRSHQTEATNNLNTANSNVATADTNKETARVALEQATADKSNADNAYEVAVGEQVSAQLEKQVADQNYADQSPGLINEHSVLQEVIDTLQSLKGYRKIDALQTCEEYGLVLVTTSDECQQAAESLGIQWNSCCQNINNEQYGCQSREGDILFNGKIDSTTARASKSNRWEICAAPG